MNIKSRNKDVNNKDNCKPHGLQALAHGFNRNHAQHQQQHLLPTMPLIHNMLNPFANADPAALLQALGGGNPYANLGGFSSQQMDRDSFKDSRKRNDNHSSRPYDRDAYNPNRDRDRNRGRDRSRDRDRRDRDFGDRRTDKWNNNRR